jgi:hypothetical protein
MSKMPLCACGCGESTKGGDFKHGHITKHRSRLEARVGGPLRLEAIVNLVENYSAGGIDLNRLGEELLRVLNENKNLKDQ